MTIKEKIARTLAGHFGPEFDKLPKDRAELRRVRRHSVVYSDNTQSELIDAAIDILHALRDEFADPVVRNAIQSAIDEE